MNQEKQNQELEYKRQVKISVKELTDILNNSEVECMMCIVRANGHTYNLTFGVISELTKTILDARNDAKSLDDILNIQHEANEKISQIVNFITPKSNNSSLLN